MILKSTAVELPSSSYRALSPFVVFLAFPFSLPVTLGPFSWFCQMLAALILLRANAIYLNLSEDLSRIRNAVCLL
jgi:hypothetical protein